MQNFRTQFRAMGGANEIVVAAGDEPAAERAMEAAAREVLRLEAKYSRYRQDSIVSRINQAAGESAPVDCDSETLGLLNFAGVMFRKSGGLFDATSGILRRAWNFANPDLPSEEQLAPLLALVAWNKVELSDGAVRLPKKGMEIDFGGIGKEYAADRAAAVLTGMGIAHGYVNLGGDISAIGPQPNGEPWLAGVGHPRRQGEVIATIPVSTGGLATSGDAEKYFEIDGRRYSHILNPKTGFPVNHWASVSVRAPSALLAGAYSTVAMLTERDAPSFLSGAKCTFFAVGLDGRITSSGKTETREYETCRPL